MAAIFDNALSLGIAFYNRYNWNFEGYGVKTEAVMAEIQSDAVTGLPEPMTEREREILACLAEGLSNQEIAARLHLALRTVKWYNSQIFGKLGVSHRREAVTQARALGVLVTSSAARSMPAVTHARHHLPSQTTPFVGRQHELAEISDLLSIPDIRLLTILAPGGMGKSRLAVAAAQAQIGRFAHGVIFVRLAPLRAAADIVTSIAEKIGFSFYGAVSPAEQLLDFLRARSVLLVLDNFEHLLDGAPLVADIVQGAPGVRVLVTSRERLNLRSETVYALRELSYPAWPALQRIEQYESVKLFMQSAHRVRPSFKLQAEDLAELARICRLTAGMPLAIELAAGWLDTLSLEHIADELQQGLDILATNLRDVPERHRSVRGTFDRTWSRLTDEERAMFVRLSVFRGGFTLPAAQAVAGSDARHLRVLAQKALIRAEEKGRFTIHELLRQFGADKLAETGESPAVQARYVAFFADFMQERRGEIYTHQQLAALERIGTDFENVRSDWKLLVDQQAFDDLPKFLDGLWFFLDVHSRSQEGIELFETTAEVLQSLPTSETTELALARLWARLAWCYNDVGLSEKAEETAEAAIHLLDRHDSPADRLVAYQGLALIFMFRGEREQLRRMAETGYALARQLDNLYWQAHSLILLSHAARQFQEELEAVLRPLRQARAIYEKLGNPWGIMLNYATEAGSAFEAGDYEQVKNSSAQCLVLAKAFGNAFFIAISAGYLGIAASWQGDGAEAWDWLRQSLRIYWDAGYAHYALRPLLGMARLLLHEDKAESAVEILALVDRHRAYRGFGLLFEIGPYRLGALREELEARLEQGRFAAVWTRGGERELSDLVTELLSEAIYRKTSEG